MGNGIPELVSFDAIVSDKSTGNVYVAFLKLDGCLEIVQWAADSFEWVTLLDNSTGCMKNHKSYGMLFFEGNLYFSGMKCLFLHLS